MKLIAIPMLLFSLVASATTNPCVVPNSSVEIEMRRSMVRDLSINEESIIDPKMEQLAEAPVSKVLANQYALIDRAKDLKRKGGFTLDHESYVDAYYANGAKTLLIKYTYENAAKQKNIFIASAIVNDNECSIRFNGYVILQRAF